MKMSPKSAASAVALFRRGIRPIFSGNLCGFSLPLPNNAPLFSSAFHSSSHKDSPFSSKPKIDLSSINDVEDALCLFGDMVKIRPLPSVVQFNKLLTVVVKMKHYSVNLSLFDKMRRLGVPVDKITMSIAINCYCLLNRVDFGFGILGTFFKSGCEPNVTTFSTLIKGLFLVAGHSLNARDLLGFFENMSCKPDVYAYSAVIDGLCKDQMVDDAFILLSRMIDKGISPNVVTYNSIIQGFAIALMDGYCLGGQMGKAKRVLHSVEDRGLTPSIMSYNSLINGYCKQGRIDEAWDLFVEVPCKGLQHDTVIYTTMIQGLFHKGRFADGWKLFNNMESRGIMPNLVTYNVLLDGLCKTHQIAEAFSFVRMMEDKGLIEDAKSLLVEMEKSGCAPNNVTYNVMIQGLLKRNELYNAMPLMEEMCRMGFLADAATVSLLLDQLKGNVFTPLRRFSCWYSFTSKWVAVLPDPLCYRSLKSDGYVEELK
ncbi:UNVERIFIED_CONTAM: putative pentatricopeptide repeat-containing protein, mitochondrial [Sesamum latifolium]|uniref:Pentatricopeptide repeat-containing protein, mitochondrial n=1 Tax=Sesamum latifolium TaxID=2727402 RepID=A0AAW2XV42_9LAMI